MLLVGSAKLSAGDIRIELTRDNADIRNVLSIQGLTAGYGYEIQRSYDLIHWMHSKNVIGGGDNRFKIFCADWSVFYRINESEWVDTPLVSVWQDASSPNARLVKISTSAETDNVPLAVFNVRSQGTDGRLRTLTLALSTREDAQTLFADIRIRAMGMTHSASTIGPMTVITDMDIPLPRDVSVPIVVYGKILRNTNNRFDGSYVTVTLNHGGSAGGHRNNPLVEDSEYEEMEVVDGSVSGSQQTFSSGDLVVTDAQAYARGIVFGDKIAGYDVEFRFNLTAGDQTIYVSANPLDALGFLVPAGTAAKFPVDLMIAYPTLIAGDSIGNHYIVPAGVTRSFSCRGLLTDITGVGNAKNLRVGFINYGFTNGNLKSMSTAQGTEHLQVTVLF